MAGRVLGVPNRAPAVRARRPGYRFDLGRPRVVRHRNGDDPALHRGSLRFATGAAARTRYSFRAEQSSGRSRTVFTGSRRRPRQRSATPKGGAGIQRCEPNAGWRAQSRLRVGTVSSVRAERGDARSDGTCARPDNGRRRREPDPGSPGVDEPQPSPVRGGARGVADLLSSAAGLGGGERSRLHRALAWPGARPYHGVGGRAGSLEVARPPTARLTAGAPKDPHASPLATRPATAIRGVAFLRCTATGRASARRRLSRQGR